MDKNKTKQILADIDVALEAVAKKHGMQSLKAKSASFTRDGAFTAKIAGTEVGGVSLEGQRYNLLRAMYNLPELGESFTYLGKTYTITGMLARTDKVLTRCSDGKAYKFPPASIQYFCAPLTD